MLSGKFVGKLESGSATVPFAPRLRPGFPGEKIDRRLLPDIRWMKHRYDILITDGAPENLSEAMPRTIEALQNWMAS